MDPHIVKDFQEPAPADFHVCCFLFAGSGCMLTVHGNNAECRRRQSGPALVTCQMYCSTTWWHLATSHALDNPRFRFRRCLNGLCIGIMEKNMETIIVYWGYVLG